jgi:uncharacterized protein
MTLSFYRTKWFWLLEHVFFAGLPSYLAITRFATKPVQHYSLMALTLVYMVIIAYLFKAQVQNLGLSVRKSLGHLAQILPTTLLLCACIVLGKSAGGIHALPNQNTTLAIMYIFISVPLQELVFRSLCVWRCSLSWRNQWFIIIFTSLNFAFYHIIFNNWQLVIGTFLLSLYWSYWYFKQKDIWTIMVSHALLGLAYFL